MIEEYIQFVEVQMKEQSLEGLEVLEAEASSFEDLCFYLGA